jgi:selenocysteine lyase/cysteine desulfurase
MLMPVATSLEELRAREFSRLDASGCAYLDYAGAALYPASLVQRNSERLLAGVLGNPHSDNAPSRASTNALDAARAATLRFIDADPADYEVIFTANASGAMRILAEAFPFGIGSRLILTADNHNSVNGIRVAARGRGAEVVYVPLDRELRAHDPRPSLRSVRAPSLFAFPAQSNFSGVRHPLEWIDIAQSRGYQVLLDVAALVPTTPFSLSSSGADFIALSFYKLFGYPTGVGALVAKRDAVASLRRQYFAGGTVHVASVRSDAVRLKDGGAAFEDGTPSFLDAAAVSDGLDWIAAIGMPVIAQHVASLSAVLLDALSELRHRVVVYGPSDRSSHGGIVAFNVLRDDGRLVPYQEVEAAARERGIAIRGGCFCNPGAAEHALGIEASLAGEVMGAVRASIGPATTREDITRLVDLVRVEFR